MEFQVSTTNQYNQLPHLGSTRIRNMDNSKIAIAVPFLYIKVSEKKTRENTTPRKTTPSTSGENPTTQLPMFGCSQCVQVQSDLRFQRWFELAQLSRDVVITHRPWRRKRWNSAGIPRVKMSNAAIVCQVKQKLRRISHSERSSRGFP